MESGQSIDMRGKTITTYIIFEASRKLKDMDDGQMFEVVTDDNEAVKSDIDAWCRMTGHRLTGVEQRESSLRFLIEKSGPKNRGTSLAMIISDPGLEEILSPLGFALGAALEGMEVSLYFQGPAVRVLKNGFKEKLSGMSRPFSVFARNGLAKAGHIPPQDKVRQLRELGAKFYICGPSMDHFGVERDELIFQDVTVSEYLTFMEVMEKADIQLYP